MWWRRQPDKSRQTAVDASLPLIRLEGVGKTFRGEADEETHALRDVTIDIGRGEYVSVSGPSGCGKSTFLAILGLLETPTTGRYWLNGRAVDRLQQAERARVRNIDVGLVFQSFNLIGDMTVEENVEYPLTLRGATDKEREGKSPNGPGPCRTHRTSEAAAGTAVRRSPATGRHRARDRRTSTDPARRRADGQSRLEER